MIVTHPWGRRFVAAFALAAVWAAIPFGGTAAPDPVEVNVVLPLTGSVALLGQSSQTSLSILEKSVNASGGIAGRPLKLVISDDQSNPQLAVQIVSRLIATKVPVVLGPNLSANCNAVTPLLKDGPVSLCFSPGIQLTEGSYVFSPAPSSLDLAIATARYAKRRGWKKMAFIFPTDSTGTDGEKVVTQTFAAPEFRDVGIADIEHFAPTDLSVAAQLAKIKSAQPDALFVWGSGTPAVTAIRDIQDAGLAIPILTAYSQASPAQMNALKGYLPKEFLIPGIPSMVPVDQLPRGPLRDRITARNREFAAAGVPPEALQTTGWDAGLLVVDALRHVGPNATAAQVREYLAGLSGFTGVTGTFDFKKIPQRGVDWKSSVLMTRWDAARNTFVAAGPLGG
jgi:branched-chain amino acid transport system substrate-binding protein